jgi:hypothetical protein
MQQAPILSFDEEGDIPIPASKHKRIFSFEYQLSKFI